MAVIFFLLFLAGCTPYAPAGTPVDVNAPQAEEQCQAQPELAWCHDQK